MVDLAVFLIAGVSSVVLTWLVRRAALSRSLLDIPNARSSHTTPTPRGGGLAIAVIVLGTALVAGRFGWIESTDALGLVGGGLLIATIGWIDDVRGLPSGVRAGAQALAAAWFLWWTGGMATLMVGGHLFTLGWPGNLLALLAIVWSTNLYNFMDGIDGLAGGQARVAASAATLLLAESVPELSLVTASIAGASLGFLMWNWSPARIFMGDVGSGLLGFLFAALALLSERGGGPPAVVWVLFGGVFFFDATVTLLRRTARGERWYAAHKSHAYQRLVQSGWSHAQASTGAIILTGVLCGFGALTARRPGWMWPAVGMGLLALSFAYLWIERRMPMRRPGSAH